VSDRIRVVVADDSAFVRRLLASYLGAAPGVEVVGTAGTGQRAVELVRRLRPDVVTLDLDMPELDGLEALAVIMREAPTPAVMISGVSGRAAGRTFTALELGAVDFVLKYSPTGDVDPASLRSEIVAKVEAAARIRVIRSLGGGRRSPAALPSLPPPPVAAAARSAPALLAGGVVAIGASTGGPIALKELLSHLPASFPAALLIVQHMPASFTGVLAAQLDRQVGLTVRQAADGDPLEPGTALVAPGGRHLLLGADSRVVLNDGPEIHGHRPSIDVTMQAVAQLYGARARGVLLTGMGHDGALGLLAIRARGGRTFAQDAQSCVVNGMPQRAIEKGAAECVASPRQIAHLLALEAPAQRRRQAC
jgi:two-component system, chemotaxis family, protein-glutamate methylesterase/glutaminase